MANSKRQCTGCKKRFPQGVMISAPVGFFCSEGCRKEYGLSRTKNLLEKAKQLTVKRHKKEKRDYQLSDIQHQHKLTQKAFNKLRVAQELKWFSDRGIEPYCISCRKTHMDWCCGHYKTVGSQGVLRYDPRNTYLQCNRYCNMALSGNIAGNKTTVGYRKGMEIRFGSKEANIIMEYCDSKAEPKKWTGEELASMRKGFSKQLKELL